MIDKLIGKRVRTIYREWVTIIFVRGNIVYTEKGLYHVTKLQLSTAY